MAEDIVSLYEPAPRFGHVAAAVEEKVYIWGGLRRDTPEVHDGPSKNAFATMVDVLDTQVSLHE